jgi:hypothetical protein
MEAFVEAFFVNSRQEDDTIEYFESEEEQLILLQELLESITTILSMWADSVPEAKRKLLRERLTRPIEFINTKSFYLDSENLRGEEVRICFEEEGLVEMFISITPKYILVKDAHFNMREAAFPLTWPS